jgi:hypothetical protein
MAYTLADIDAIVTKLEASLAKGYAEVTHDGHHLVYRSTDEILRAIGYFKGLRGSATDVPAQAVDKRTFFLFGGGGR